jgi:hypothetical protein
MDPVSCPTVAANITGWACSSKTELAVDLTAQAICCGEGVVEVQRRGVLIVAASAPELRADVQDLLNTTGAFARVDIFNAAQFGDATPSVAQLSAYEAVLVYSDPVSRPCYAGRQLG